MRAPQLAIRTQAGFLIQEPAVREGNGQMGRPTKLEPDLEHKILMPLKVGAHLKVAAASAGISEATLFRWMRDPRREYREFRAKVEQAKAEGEVFLLGQIVRAAPNHPGTALKILERRHPERWSRAREGAIGPDPDDLFYPAPKPQEPDPNVVSLPREWWYPMVKLVLAAKRGLTPAEFFGQRGDRFAALREGDGPGEGPGPWWRSPNETIDGAGESPLDDASSDPPDDRGGSAETEPGDS
jgi:hypothetical protein